MKTSTPIPMNRPGRLLKKTRDYLTDMDIFLSDTSGAVTVLLDSLPHADTALILKMLPLLGYAGKDRSLEPLYRLMTDASSDEQVRRSAAIQLGLAASLSNDPKWLITALIEGLNHPDPSFRSSCALALGCEGNGSAVDALMAHLQDSDRDVQAAIVVALSSVGDVRVFDRLVGRLKMGRLEEQRSILLNLWRFADLTPRVENVYLGWLDRFLPDLRMDTVSALGMLPISNTILDAYGRLLNDDNPGVRHQVLDNLGSIDPVDYAALNARLHHLLSDVDNRVRQAAIRLLARV